MTIKKEMLLMRKSLGLLILLLLFSSALHADPANKSSKELLALKGEGFLLYLGDRDFEDTQQPPGLELRIEGVSTALFEYLSLEKPSRFVIDITGLQVLRPESMDVQENPLVRRIRVGVHEKKTRIVLDLKLKKAPRFVVSDEGNAKIFRLLPDDAPYAQEGVLIVPQKDTPPMPSPTPSLIEEPTNQPEASPSALSLFEEPRLPTPEFTPTPEMLATQFAAPSETPSPESQIQETEVTPSTVEEEQPTIVPTETPTQEFSPTPTETPEEELEETPTPTPQEEEPTATPTETATETSAIITSREAEITPVATPVMDITMKPLVSTTTPEEVANIPLIEGQKPSTPSLSQGSPQVPIVRLGEIEVGGETQKANVEVPLEKVLEAAKIEFQLDRVLVIFKDGDPAFQNVHVRNPASRRLFMSAAAQILKNPGTPKEERVATQDLLVSPRRFAVDPGSEKTIRLMLRQLPADVERVFGITFAANKDGFESEYINVKIDGKDTRLRVETNLSITVLAEPPSPKVLIGTQRTEDAVIISNRGTVSVRLTGGKVCRQGGVNQCIPINQKRLYPDDSWRLKVPADWSVSFIKDSVLGFEPLFVAPMER